MKLLVLITKAEPHPKSSYSKDQTTSTTSQPPIQQKYKKKKPKIKFEPKKLTPDLESKAIVPPDYRTKYT